MLFPLSSKRLSLSERIIIFDHLGLYLHSGIPITQAVGAIRDTASRHASREALDSVLTTVRKGASLAKALEGCLQRFSHFEVYCISIGERSGKLPEALLHLATLLRHRRALRSRVWSALAYPLLVIVGALIITGVLVLYVFPKITPLFEGLGTELPLATRILVAVSEGLTDHWFSVVLVVTFCVFAIPALLRIPKVQRQTDHFLLTLPLVRDLIRLYCVASLLRTVSLLLDSGISLIPALTLAQQGSNNSVYKVVLAEISEHVSAGQKLSAELARHPNLFPPEAAQFVAAGEATGTLAKSLRTCADLYEQQVAERTQTLAGLIEPMFMVIVGGIVGFIAIAIVSPIYGISEGLYPH